MILSYSVPNPKQIRKHEYKRTFWLLSPFSNQKLKDEKVWRKMHRLLPSSLSTSPRTENIPDNVTVTCPQSLAHKRLPNPSSYLLKRLFFFLGFLFQRTLGTFCVLPLTTQIFSQLFQFLFQCSTLMTKMFSTKQDYSRKEAIFWIFRKIPSSGSSLLLLFWHFYFFIKTWV